LTELRRPVPLDPVRHRRELFDSGEPALDEWLRRYAGQKRRRDTAATWVITDADDVVVAYASVAMTGIDRSAARTTLTKAAPDPIPALLLGRLAVNHRYANLGVGTALTAHVLATAIELNTKAACRAVVVTALHPKARAWWHRLGFHPFHPDNPDELDLYLLTSEIGTTLEKARQRKPPGTACRAKHVSRLRARDTSAVTRAGLAPLALVGARSLLTSCVP
jgi:GNAT superfamily N-acetyltransferase